METLDIVCGVVLVIGFFAGIKEGLVKQVAGLVGLIAGILVGKALYVAVGAHIAPILGLSVKVSQMAAFILILILVPLLFSLVGWFIARMLSAVSLGGINRLLGAVFGVLKYALLLGLFFTFFELFDTHGKWISQTKRESSVLYYPIYYTSHWLFKSLQESVGEDLWIENKKEEKKEWKNPISL